VAGFAKRLPILLVPKLDHITAMRLYVVDSLAAHHAPLAKTSHA
jgi:hypothetical protein